MAAFYSAAPFDTNRSAARKAMTPLWLAVLALLWALAGTSGLLYSIVCVGRPGRAVDQVMGFVIAALFGPLYWLFFATNKAYCRAAH